MLAGNDYDVSATWEIERRGTRLLLDFSGLDDLKTLPIERSYGCGIRGFAASRPKPTQTRPNRPWRHKLAAFVRSLDAP